MFHGCLFLLLQNVDYVLGKVGHCVAPVVAAQVTDYVSCKPVAFGFLCLAAMFPGLSHAFALPGTQTSPSQSLLTRLSSQPGPGRFSRAGSSPYGLLVEHIAERSPHQPGRTDPQDCLSRGFCSHNLIQMSPVNSPHTVCEWGIIELISL